MKRFATITALFVLGFSSLASAQASGDFRDHNGTSVNGDTFTYWVAAGGTHYVDFNVYNVNSSAVTFKVRKTNQTIVSGASTWFCVYHNADANDPQSQCYIPTTVNSGTFATDPGDFNMLLCDFSAGSNTGTTIVRYNFYDNNNQGDSTWITLIYNVTPAGVADHAMLTGKMSEPTPNPATSTSYFTYELFSGNNPYVQVTDIQGRTVATLPLNGMNGMFELEVTEFTAGVYTVNLISDEGIVSRKKLVVQ